MAALLRPTLGPIPRTVAIASIVNSGPPEILDTGATIARRTIELPDPYENMGAMLIRHVAWAMFERCGDGAATAAVLAQAVLREAERYIAAGGSPVAVRRGVERGVAAAANDLRRRARPIDGPAELARVAAAILPDPALAELVGEIVDAVGPDGITMVDHGQGVGASYEYADGMRWETGYVSPFFAEPGATAANVLEPRVLATDYELERAEQLLPALEACVGAGDRALLVVAPEVRDSAAGLLIVNRQQGKLEGALAVRAPAPDPNNAGRRAEILEDIAVATGGRCISQRLGRRLEDVTVDDLGCARQAWATAHTFAILGPRGDRAAIRERVAAIRAELAALGDDEHRRRDLRERIGKLSGAAALIRVGAPSDQARAELVPRVEAALKAAQLALAEGGVPGGGAALLVAARAAEALELPGDEAVGARLLAAALAEPLRAIAANAGLDPEPIVHEARRRGPVWAFDAARRAWVDPWDDGPVDPLAVVLAALETGVSAAAAAITGEVLVRRRRPLWPGRRRE
jgi:chaperonin GroEL